MGTVHHALCACDYHAPEHIVYVHRMRTSCALQVSLLFQRATVHDLESRRRSWKDAQEIVRSSQGPATQVITVHGAAQRLTTRHGGDGDGVGDRDGDEDSEGDEGDEVVEGSFDSIFNDLCMRSGISFDEEGVKVSGSTTAHGRRPRPS